MDCLEVLVLVKLYLFKSLSIILPSLIAGYQYLPVLVNVSVKDMSSGTKYRKLALCHKH